ncbi:MAG: primosomal protein N' (replication factor Y) - superfamily II helicase, partial [Bacteroidota bacterium]
MQTQSKSANNFPCSDCGAALTYQPGTSHLACQHCGAQNEIPRSKVPIEDLPYEQYLVRSGSEQSNYTETFIDCPNCGAASSFSPHITSSYCPYCATPLIKEKAYEALLIQPNSLLPFRLGREEAQAAFSNWIDKLWFAPNVLKKVFLDTDHFKGVYVPFWTFDADTETFYKGERGEYYYETETRSELQDGEWVETEEEVRKTRWWSAKGSVKIFFDDFIIPATQSLPEKKLLI